MNLKHYIETLFSRKFLWWLRTLVYLPPRCWEWVRWIILRHIAPKSNIGKGSRTQPSSLPFSKKIVSECILGRTSYSTTTSFWGNVVDDVRNYDNMYPVEQRSWRMVVGRKKKSSIREVLKCSFDYRLLWSDCIQRELTKKQEDRPHPRGGPPNLL